MIIIIIIILIIIIIVVIIVIIIIPILSGTCVSKTQDLCDFHPDCPGGQDENLPMCCKWIVTKDQDDDNDRFDNDDEDDNDNIDKKTFFQMNLKK